MKTIKTNKRYLSEVFNELPKGIINKKLADVGGTYLAANCKYNYIVNNNKIKVKDNNYPASYKIVQYL